MKVIVGGGYYLGNTIIETKAVGVNQNCVIVGFSNRCSVIQDKYYWEPSSMVLFWTMNT